MSRLPALLFFALLFIVVGPAVVDAQPSRLWLVGGATFTALRGDCQTCEEDFPYRRAPGVLVGAGRRLTDQMDVGGEAFWVRTDTASGSINSTHLDAVAQFRPWSSRGFFLKGGAGMAFTRNWVDATGPDPFNEKVLSVVIGAGWVFRPAARVGLQIFGTQHVGAIGDLQTAEGDIPDVVGNFWSVGAALVFR